jgi:hypothetical protein
MYRLTIKGRPIGPELPDEESAIKAVIRLWPVMHGLGWTKC